MGGLEPGGGGGLCKGRQVSTPRLLQTRAPGGSTAIASYWLVRSELPGQKDSHSVTAQHPAPATTCSQARASRRPSPAQGGPTFQGALSFPPHPGRCPQHKELKGQGQSEACSGHFRQQEALAGRPCPSPHPPWPGTALTGGPHLYRHPLAQGSCATGSHPSCGGQTGPKPKDGKRPAENPTPSPAESSRGLGNGKGCHQHKRLRPSGSPRSPGARRSRTPTPTPGHPGNSGAGAGWPRARAAPPGPAPDQPQHARRTCLRGLPGPRRLAGPPHPDRHAQGDAGTRRGPPPRTRAQATPPPQRPSRAHVAGRGPGPTEQAPGVCPPRGAPCRPRPARSGCARLARRAGAAGAGRPRD